MNSYHIYYYWVGGKDSLSQNPVKTFTARPFNDWQWLEESFILIIFIWNIFKNLFMLSHRF